MCELCCRAKRETPKDSHSAFMRALLLGSVAAAAGLILYAAFEIMTGWIIGYLSLAVGFMVGKAMKIGAKGAGGRRYQITAALLTYMAVSLAAIPVAFSQIAKHKAERREFEAKQRPADQPGGATPQQPSTKIQPAPQKPAQPTMGIGAVLIRLLLIGLISPFLELQDPFHGLIGLLILSIGIRIAWKTTEGASMEIDGPYDNPAPAST